MTLLPTLMTVLELNHVALHVADLAASMHFYGEVLGFPQMPRPDFRFPGAWYRLGPAQELHLIGGRTEPVQSSNRGTHYALRVADMDAVVQHLAAANVPLARALKQRPDGALQLFVADPDGHHIEFFHFPHT